MELDEKLLEELCEKYRFTYHIMVNAVVIKTMCANWKFDYTQKPYHLYHKPVCLGNYNCSININDGYHDQKKSYHKLDDLMEYIYTHDKNYFIKKKPKLKRKNKKRKK